MTTPKYKRILLKLSGEALKNGNTSYESLMDTVQSTANVIDKMKDTTTSEEDFKPCG